MATVFKRSRSPYWQAAFYDHQGRRVYRSTGEVKKTAAKDVAAEFELGEKKARKNAQEHQPEIAKLVAQAGVEAAKGTLGPEKARRLIAKIYKIANHSELPSFSISDWLDHWLSEKESNLKPKTFERYSGSIREIKKALGQKSSLSLTIFGPQHAKEVRSVLIKNRGRSRNATINIKLTDFKSALSAAYSEGLTERNLASSLDLLPEDDSKLVWHFEPEEVQQLLKGASGDWRTVILISATTGLRLSDIIDLDWSSVQLPQKRLVVTPKKQKRGKHLKSVTIPISESVVLDLESRRNSKRGAVFPGLRKKTTATHSTNFSNLMKRVGVPRQIQLENGRTGHRSFHSLRHSFATWLLQAEVEKDIRKSLMAHSSDDVHQIYASHDSDSLRKATDRLPTFT